MTGHGNFQKHLARLGLADNNRCICGANSDSIGHFLIECPLFNSQREALRDFIPPDDWKWPEATHFLVSTLEAFSVLADYFRIALWLKSHYNSQTRDDG